MHGLSLKSVDGAYLGSTAAVHGAQQGRRWG